MVATHCARILQRRDRGDILSEFGRLQPFMRPERGHSDGQAYLGSVLAFRAHRHRRKPERSSRVGSNPRLRLISGSMRWLLGILFAFAQGAGAESFTGKDVRVADGDVITILTADRQTRRIRIAAASHASSVPAAAPKPPSPSVTKTTQASETSSLTAPTPIAVAEAPAPARGAEPRDPRPVAAGLGRLHVLSALGQRFRAEIDIVSLRRGEEDGLRVGLASAEAFRQAGIEINPALIGVNMTIQLRDGKPIVVVATRGSVNEPFLEMLVELEWASGHFLRKYTILLDPPITIPPPPSDAVIGSMTSSAAPSAEPTPMTSGGDYEVVQGDTLAKIAGEHMPAGATLDQVMVALYRANPDAFGRDNINLLPAGSILKIPHRDAVAAVERDEAKALVLSHRVSFGAYRRAIAATTPTPVSGATAAREDDRIASERALAEAKSRIGELEKNVADLRKLIEIRNQRLAELEKRAAEAQPAPAVAPVVKPAVEAPKPTVEAPKPAPTPAKPAAKPKPAAPPRPTPPAPEPSLVDEYFDDPLMLGGLGAVGLFLIGYGAYAWRKWRRARSDIDVRLLGAVSLDLDVGNGKNNLH
jgi:FimV-like protein